MSRYFLGLQYKVHMLRHVELWLSRSLKVEKEKKLPFELDDPEKTMVSSIYRTLRDYGGERRREQEGLSSDLHSWVKRLQQKPFTHVKGIAMVLQNCISPALINLFISTLGHNMPDLCFSNLWLSLQPKHITHRSQFCFLNHANFTFFLIFQGALTLLLLKKPIFPKAHPLACYHYSGKSLLPSSTLSFF